MRTRRNIAGMISKIQTAVRHLAALRTCRVLFSALLAVANSSLFTLHSSLLSSCTFDTAEESVAGQQAVGFGSYTEQFSTRSEVNRSIPDGGSMGIYAYLHDNSNWNSDKTAGTLAPNFMWNQQATYQSDINAFVYTPLKYWPNEESDKLSFIAYYPYTAESPDHPESPAYPDNATGLRTLLPNDGNGLPSFDFTVKDAAAEQVDLLISDLIRNLPESRARDDAPGTAFNSLTVYDQVKFVFHHALSKVEFRIVADADIRKDIVGFRINSLAITNILTVGRLTPQADDTYEWTGRTTPHTYACNTYEPYLLLPQELAADAMFEIDYQITFKSDGTTYHYDGTTPVPDQDYTYANTASLYLNKMKMAETGTELTEWLPNHHYIYNIHLRANRIDFTGEVVAWGDEITPPDVPIEER